MFNVLLDVTVSEKVAPMKRNFCEWQVATSQCAGPPLCSRAAAGDTAEEESKHGARVKG